MRAPKTTKKNKVPPHPDGPRTETPGKRLERLLKAKFPNELQETHAGRLGVGRPMLSLVINGARHGTAEFWQRAADLLGLHVDDLMAKPTPLDTALASEEGFREFLGIDADGPFRKWIVQLLELIKAERNKRWEFLKWRDDHLTNKAKEKAIIAALTAEYNTTPENKRTEAQKEQLGLFPDKRSN